MHEEITVTINFEKLRAIMEDMQCSNCPCNENYCDSIGTTTSCMEAMLNWLKKPISRMFHIKGRISYDYEFDVEAENEEMAKDKVYDMLDEKVNKDTYYAIDIMSCHEED